MKELATVTDFNIFSVLESAVQKGMDADALTKLVDLQERIARNEAEQAYNAAMKKAQGSMPKIIKTKTNKQTNSMYADLGAINEQITPIYTKHGFSLSFTEGVAKRESDIRIICHCSHEKGHTREFFTDLPIDNVGMQGSVNKTMVHGIASTFSYGQRYLIKMIFNLSIDEEDDDAQSAGKTEHEAIIKKEAYAAGLKKGTDCGKAWLKHVDVIMNVKDQLAVDDYHAAAEYLYSLSNKELTEINLAPTKGGIFTVEEMKKMDPAHNPDWAEAKKVGLNLNKDVDRSL
jgi:hypothetical protein